MPQLKANESEIGRFLNDMSSKRNKKEVLDALFKKYDLPKYDEVDDARRIAQAMTKSEIDSELVTIIKGFRGMLENLYSSKTNQENNTHNTNLANR